MSKTYTVSTRGRPLGAGLARRPESSEDITTATFPPCANENSQATLAARQPPTICGLQLVPILEAYGGGTFETLQRRGFRPDR